MQRIKLTNQLFTFTINEEYAYLQNLPGNEEDTVESSREAQITYNYEYSEAIIQN